VEGDTAAETGARLRRARLAGGHRQRDVAATAVVSQSTISRMELGQGASVPLDKWVRVAAVVGLDLAVVVRPTTDRAEDAIQRRCHRLVVELALVGGWTAWTLMEERDAAACETVLERKDRQEVAIVRVWDVIGDVAAAMADFDRRLDLERSDRGPGWRVSGAVVITATGHNRRRLSDTGRPVDRAFPVRGSLWLSCLRHLVPMPSAPGMLWTDARMERLRPFLPYLDHRLRNRRRGYRPRRRRAA